MKTNPVGWFEIYVQDLQRAQAFYEAVLDGKLEPLQSPGMEMLAFPMDMATPGAAGALVKMEGKASADGGTLIYFKCNDCAVESSRIAPAGGRIFKPKFSIGQYGFIALAYDTEGNMFGLHSIK